MIVSSAVIAIAIITPNVDCIDISGNPDSIWFSFVFNDGKYCHANLNQNDLRDFHDVLVDYENTDYDVLELEFVDPVGTDRNPVITRKQAKKLIILIARRIQ